jgi:hypothetical protein
VQKGVFQQIVGEDIIVLHSETSADQVLTSGGSTVEAELAALGASASGKARVYVVEDIDERDDLTDLVIGDKAFVIDATGDSTVTSGAAEYIFTGITPGEGGSPDFVNWVKIAEEESLDVVLSWSNITGKPSSTASAIDGAVTNSHTHSNKATLDKFTEGSNGLPLYDGAQIGGIQVVPSIPSEPSDGLYFVTGE